MKNTILFLLILFTAYPHITEAQMFSVDERSRTSDPFAPYIRGGVKSVNFSYTGGVPTENFFEFNGLAATAMFESSGFTLQASLGNDFSGLEEHNYFDLGISFLNPFYVLRSKNVLLGIPIRLSSKVVSIRNENIEDEFSQTNLSAGAGALAQLHIPGAFGAFFQILPNYGFSSASGGFIGGSVFSLNGKARINIYELFFGRNVSIGYDYNFAAYDIDDELYDYDFNSHTLTLGVSL